MIDKKTVRKPLQHTNTYVSQFVVARMDCPAEEQLIRMSMDGLEENVALQFDIPNRKLKVFHHDNFEEIQARIESLGLGAKHVYTHQIDRKRRTNCS